MSIITIAALKGLMRMGVVVVESLNDEAGEGIGYSGGDGRVRSKVGGEDDQSQ